jgi:hypothetical protein
MRVVCSTGLLTLEEIHEYDFTKKENVLVKIYITSLGWSLVSIGSLYFLLGVFCIKGIIDKRLARYR